MDARQTVTEVLAEPASAVAEPVGNAVAGPVGNAVAGPVGNAVAGPVGNAVAGPVGNAVAGPVGNAVAGSVVPRRGEGLTASLLPPTTSGSCPCWSRMRAGRACAASSWPAVTVAVGLQAVPAKVEGTGTENWSQDSSCRSHSPITYQPDGTSGGSAHTPSCAR
ncbi:hypothetical protein GCM10017771_05900 [Streptomyces capitiformicae]|uniref:DUF4774 domain-containing protein n=1 Tax=Streptomyces capitiformicae TaxID=2014920 RepID=A0A919GE19_9ACTN|nr:hypothetical protein GCM10017771_05900 [Streptomyces capitiformicae]